MNTDLAACTDSDPELWFAQGGTPQRRFALRMCNGAPAEDGRPARPPCPVRDACLKAALKAEALADSGRTYGVFGGLTAEERGRLLQLMCQRCHVEPRPKSGSARYCPPCRVLAKNEWKRKAELNRGAA